MDRLAGVCAGILIGLMTLGLFAGCVAIAIYGHWAFAAGLGLIALLSLPIFLAGGTDYRLVPPPRR